MSAELINGKSKFTPAVIKGIFLAIFGIAAIYFVGNFLNSTIKSYSGIALIKLIVAISVFLLIFFFQTLFLRSKWQLNLVVFLEVLTLTFCLKDVLLYKSILVGLILFWIVLLYGAFLASREIENTLKISFYRVNHIVFSQAITAFSLLLAIIGGVIFFNFLSQQAFDFQKLITPLLGITEKILPSNFISNLIRNILKGFIEQQISSDAKLKLLPEAQREKIIEDALKQIEKEMGGKLDASAIFKNKEIQVFLQGLSDKFLNIPPQTKVYIAVALSLAIFFTLKGVGVVLTWPLTLIAFLFYELLLATNFAKISIEQTNKEKISL
ncbi:hypothetical protein COS59_00705 [Candidatus Wolfebacteria bacterium CG03_land_8_20_14_0_80_36_15]|uniref:Uncharacterized protein n=1 Tax=Candidatus Wolfebacteria bacterium CG03_land_8_20_14_0_80_36_15 TaxID=1975067 RepID=A0A2M7B825_9BACT|nr:MAG: hypothetical protein COS59_00705 [Candidatus Wolfebacteria bacterium CG03_land_8_20_14_0_80_36_15]